ncbi:B12-binding domain-containing radical SAM protein [Candidatus Pelagibacter sp.]|nr:B12-binding domain-containing radical SAM protein [Candidatus Pelagibacter sp.]MDC1049490.1 radical SAM protein [Candidatus Pelagibacter sp.]
MPLDILFIHPNASKKIYQGLSSEHSAIEPPIWAGMLANHCRNKNYNVKILDCEVERLDYITSAKKINEIKPRIACFVVYGQQPSASSQNMEGAIATSEELKLLDPEIKILFVGGHVSALPIETLTTEKSIDFIALNEGVYSISSLLKVENLNDEKYLKNVKGIGFRNKDNQIVINHSEIIVPKKLLDIDLPGVAWDLLPSLKKYRTAGWHSWSNDSEKEPFAALYTSLGCPYTCSFCMINIINRTDSAENISSQDSNIFRWWNPEFIIKQFDYFAEQGVKNIKIADELFVLNPNHFIKICDMIIERKYDFNIWAYSRIDTCKPQYLDKLKKAGVNWLGLGIENPSSVIRKEVHKDAFKNVKIIDIINSIRNAGINVAANYIFGLPEETEESLEFTYNFAEESNTEMVNFYSAMAYPGSPLHLESKKNNIILPKTYSGYSQHSYDTQNLPSAHLSASEILAFRDKAWDKYHTNPKYLKLLENKFGMNAVNNLKETTKIKLKRKLLGDQP